MSDELDSPESHVRARTPEQVAAAEQKAKPLGQTERAPRNDDDYVECGKALLKALATPLTLNRIRRWGEAPGGYGRNMAEDTLYWLELHKRIATFRQPNNPQKMYYDPLVYNPPLTPMCAPPPTLPPVEVMPPLPRKDEIRTNMIARLTKSREEKPKPMANENLISKIEAAKILGVKPSWLGPKANNKGLKRERVQGKLHYDKTSVESLAANRAATRSSTSDEPAPKKMSKKNGRAPKGPQEYVSAASARSVSHTVKHGRDASFDEKMGTILKAHSLGIFEDAEALAKIKNLFHS